MKQQKSFFTLLVVIVVAMAFVPAILAQETEKININKASVEELTQLKRIGPKIGQRIVEYREKHGPFGQPEDIMKVKGIGPKTLELIKDQITVE